MFRRALAVIIFVWCHGTAAAGPTGFVYALQQVNGGPNQIFGFRFDQASGVLGQLPGFPVASGGTGTAGTNSEQLALGGGRLFVLNDGDNTLTIFDINFSTGALTAVSFSPVLLGPGQWGCVAAHASGSPVVVGNGAGGLSSFVIDASSAFQAFGSPYATGSAVPFSCRFSQDGIHVYTGGNSGTTIAGFRLGYDGILSALPGSPFNSGGANPGSLATDGSERLFSAMGGGGEVRAFVTTLGAISGVNDNPFPSGLSTATHGVVHPAGFYMVADRSGNRVGVYQILGGGTNTTLNAVAGSPFATGGNFTDALALTPDGAHLIAANGTSRNLTVFQVNQLTGALVTPSIQPANTLGVTGNVTGLVFAAAEAGFVYALKQYFVTNYIYGFRINPATGVLEALPGFPVVTGGNALNTLMFEALAYGQGRLYAVNGLSGTLSAFKVNRTTGALTQLPFSPLPTGSGGKCVAVHPSGSPVVVGRFNALVSYDVNATTATAAPGSPFPVVGADPLSCVFSTGGNYFYTGGDTGNAFAAFAVNSQSGELISLVGSPFVAGGIYPAAYAVDPTERLFLVTSNPPGFAAVMAYTTSFGVPTGVSGDPFASGVHSGTRGVRHPSGFYMVTAPGDDGVAVYRIAGIGAGTTVTPIAGSPFVSGGHLPGTLALSDYGGWLVAGNSSTANLTVFSVNPVTGQLLQRFIQPLSTVGSGGGDGHIDGLVFVPSALPFLDDPLTTSTLVKAMHIIELRARINAVRAQYGVGPFAFTDPNLTVASTVVRAAHVAELRTALAPAYTALGMTPPSYTDPTLGAGSTVVKFAHIMELRAAVLAIE